MPFPSPRDFPNSTQDQTCVSCFGRQILYHCTTWEVQVTIKSVTLPPFYWFCDPEGLFNLSEQFLVYEMGIIITSCVIVKIEDHI